MKIKELTFGPMPNPHQLSYEFTKGQLYLVLGNNGAGKTSLLRTLAGIDSPISGKIEYREQVFFLPSQMPPSPWLTGQDVQRIMAPISGQYSLNDNLDIDNFKPKLMGQVSLGEKRRIHLTSVFQSNASHLLLDEPINGLDWDAQLRFETIVRDQVQQGRCLIISLHQLHWASLFPEAETLFLENLGCRLSGKFSDIIQQIPKALQYLRKTSAKL